MAGIDPNDEWLGHVQPVGLVVAPIVLARYGLTPAKSRRAPTPRRCARSSRRSPTTASEGADPAPSRPVGVLRRHRSAGGRPRSPARPAGRRCRRILSSRSRRATPRSRRDWAVADPDGGWQILVRIEAPGVKPDERGALAGWEATPHQRFERLLREKQIPIGLLITDDELRLIYAPRGETSGWLTFPLRSLAEVGGRPMLGGLKLLLSSFRLHNDAPERRLPALLKASRDAQAEVSTQLAAQVLGALHELLRGLHAADRERIETLAREPRPSISTTACSTSCCGSCSCSTPRTAISSRRAPTPRRGRFYDQGYGVRSLYAQLLDDRAHHPDTMDERRGAWGRLLALFRLVHHGDSTGWIRGRGGQLFDPAVFPFLQGQEQRRRSRPRRRRCRTAASCASSTLLITVDGEKLSYRTLDVEQIGSVYETVMGFTVETRPGPALAIKRRQERPHAGLRRPRGAGGDQGSGAGEVPQGGGRPQRAVATRSARRSRRRRTRPRRCRGAAADRRRARLARRPCRRRRERRCCSRPTSAGAPAAITRRAR